MQKYRSVCWRYAIALIATSLAVAASAGTFEKELGTDIAAATGRVKIDLMSRGGGSENGTGPVPFLRALGAPPKRVALVSFYVWDAGNVQQSIYNTAMTWKFTRTVTASGIERVASGLYDAGLSPLRDTMGSFGMTLLSPEEFLETPAKSAAYQSFKLQYGGLGKLMGFLGSKDRSVSYAAEGFRLLELPANVGGKNKDFRMAAQGGDEKLFIGLGHDLAGALEVDAVLIIYNVLQAKSKSIELLDTYAYMFGPNPVPNPSASLYWTGHQYTGVHLPLGVSVLKTGKDGQEVTNDFAGYGLVVRSLGTKMGEYLKEKTVAVK